MFCDYVVNILFAFGPICFGQRTTILSMLYCTLCMNNAFICIMFGQCFMYIIRVVDDT